MLDVDDPAEIRRLHRTEGLSIKAISRRAEIARNTVRSALRSDAPPVYMSVSPEAQIVDALASYREPMADDTWFSRALPILEALARRENDLMVDLGDIADETGIPAEDVDRELERLIGSDYLQGQLRRTMTRGQRPPMASL